MSHARSLPHAIPGNRQLFLALMEQTPDRVYFKDLQSRFMAVSHELARKHGCEKPEDLVGLTDFDFFTEEHAREAFEDERRIILTGEPVINKEEREVWTDGAVSWASTTKVPLFLESGKIAGIMGISRDVTEQHRARELIEHQNDIMSRDLESARQVQTLMIPGRLPEFDGLKIGVAYRPMEAVGGDIVVFPVTPHKYTFFFVGDVCGHGLSAAMYTVLVRHLADQVAADYAGAPEQFLRQMNALLVGQFRDRFMSALGGHLLLNPEGKIDFAMANAGHPFPLRWHHGHQQLKTIELPESLAIGFTSECASAPVSGTLQPGDRLFLFTDGIPEILDANEPGTMRALLEDTIALPPQKQADAVVARATQVGLESGHEDDLTLVVIEAP